jgi:hypothetical protein
MAQEKVSRDGLAEAVVRRGTVVWGGDPKSVDTGMKDQHGNPIWRFEEGAAVHSGPGETVRLPQADVDRLRDLGFLVDPAGPVIKTGLGPSYDLEDGQPVIAEA